MMVIGRIACLSGSNRNTNEFDVYLPENPKYQWWIAEGKECISLTTHTVKSSACGAL
jgi:hypothetical protein